MSGSRPVTLNQAAMHVGLASRTLRDLVNRKIVPDPRQAGLDTFRLGYIEHLRAVASNHATDDGITLTGERARLAKEQADAQELKNQELRGELVRGEDVDVFLVSLVSAFTQRIRAIPAKAAPEVRATRSDAQGEAVLTQFHDEALQELAEAGRAAADRVARGGSREVAEVVRGVRGRGGAASSGDGQRVGGPGEEAEPGKQRGAGSVEDEEG